MSVTSLIKNEWCGDVGIRSEEARGPIPTSA
jgi:hypothetical protein